MDYFKKQEYKTLAEAEKVLVQKLPYELVVMVINEVVEYYKDLDKWWCNQTKVIDELKSIRTQYIQGWIEHEEQFIFPSDYMTWLEAYLRDFMSWDAALFNSYELVLFKKDPDFHEYVVNHLLMFVSQTSHERFKPRVESITDCHWNYVTLQGVHGGLVVSLTDGYNPYYQVRVKKAQRDLMFITYPFP